MAMSKDRVTIVDDTLRHQPQHQFGFVTQQWYTTKRQTVVHGKKVFEGRHLEITVRRARRWMHGGKFPHVGAPRHIALAWPPSTSSTRRASMSWPMLQRLKTPEAWLRGYWRFDVNGEHFWLYHRAQQRRTEITGPVSFTGQHVLKGWISFFMRVGSRRRMA